MGRSGSGKTSMRQIIFSNHVAKDTRRFGATIDVDTADVRFLGDMKLDLWDCGGQESFMNTFLNARRDSIFRHVQSLIYIFDVESPQFSTMDMHYFTDCLDALRQYAGPVDHSDTASSVDDDTASTTSASVGNGGAHVHVLIHKLDLIPPHQRRATLDRRRDEISRKCKEHGFDDVQLYGTSIWDETLYGAWSQIVSALIPNVSMLRKHMRTFADDCRASEVVLFEKQTLLIISRFTSSDEEQRHGWEMGRFDKICQYIKIFRLNCNQNMRNNFQALTLRSGCFAAVLDVLTPNTYIMVVASTPGVEPGGIEMLIDTHRSHWTRLQAANWAA